jgi:hypothetical protein
MSAASGGTGNVRAGSRAPTGAGWTGGRCGAGLARRGRGQLGRLLVGAGGCGEAAGALDMSAVLRREIAGRALPLAVVEAGCTGMCHQAVQVTLQRPGLPDLTFGDVGAGQAASLVDVAAGRRPPEHLPDAFTWRAGGDGELPGPDRVPFLAGQRRVLLEHAGRVDPADVDEALARGVYRGLAQALALGPERVVAEVGAAGLLGRGAPTSRSPASGRPAARSPECDAICWSTPRKASRASSRTATCWRGWRAASRR